jgi:raffinose/stachyose/melibiose transport system substrate-binding protein
MAVWDTNEAEVYNRLGLEERFQRYYPNVSIEVEQSKDDTEYWNSMMIRMAANQLPDIMFNKPFTLTIFKDCLYDLSDDLSAEIVKNTLAMEYSLDGQVLGLPEKSVDDYVYYWKDMFEEAGVSVPLTWDEFLQAAQTLQDRYGKEDAGYGAIALGVRDEWPTYPFTEFMPALVSGNGEYWNSMVLQDAPFAEGTDINRTYRHIYELFTAGLCGRDPLEIGQDQAVIRFAQRKAGMIAAGPWCLADIRNASDDISELATFYLPARDRKDELFYCIMQGDNLMGVTAHSGQPELAKELVRFFFSKDWYEDYINSIPDGSTMLNFPKRKDPVLAAADAAVPPDAVTLIYGTANENFTALQQHTGFDYKQLGAHMFLPGFDLQTELNSLNARWAAARQDLGLSAE